MPLAQNCTQVLVWHTKAAHHFHAAELQQREQQREKYEGTNLQSLIASM
jgi:hypothetical protein